MTLQATLLPPRNPPPPERRSTKPSPPEPVVSAPPPAPAPKPAPFRPQAVRLVGLLALQAAFGASLMAAGAWVAEAGVAGMGAFALLVAANATIVGMLAGRKPVVRHRGLLAAGVVAGGAVAAVGAVLAASSPAWHLLTAAGALVNMELIVLAVALPLLRPKS